MTVISLIVSTKYVAVNQPKYSRVLNGIKTAVKPIELSE